MQTALKQVRAVAFEIHIIRLSNGVFSPTNSERLGGTVEGDPEVKVNNFSKIEEGKPGTLTFLANPKYEHFIYQTEASIVLVNNDFTPAEPVKATLVKVANAYASLAILLNMVEQANVKKRV